jgi:hypothetical protein
VNLPDTKFLTSAGPIVVPVVVMLLIESFVPPSPQKFVPLRLQKAVNPNPHLFQQILLQRTLLLFALPWLLFFFCRPARFSGNIQHGGCPPE